MTQKIKNLSIFLTIALVFFACQKIQNDKVYPVILMEGYNPMKLIQGCEWIEPGFSVKDDKSGTQLFTTGLPYTGSSGEYYVDYIAIDSDSNMITRRRVVNIGPLTIQDVVGEYQVDDTTGLNDKIISYKSTISLFSSSPLLLKLNNLNENLMAFLTFDSTGYLGIDYNSNDTLITGSGNYSCDKTSFHLQYYINPPDEGEHHYATFTKIK